MLMETVHIKKLHYVNFLFYVKILISFIGYRASEVNVLNYTYHFNRIFSPFYQLILIFY